VIVIVVVLVIGFVHSTDIYVSVLNEQNLRTDRMYIYKCTMGKKGKKGATAK